MKVRLVDNRYEFSFPDIPWADFSSTYLPICRSLREELGPDSFGWDSIKKVWWCAMDHIGHAKNKFLGNAPHLAETQNPAPKIDLDFSCVHRKLYDFQEQAVQLLKDRGWNGILAMGLGTGKTCTAIASAALINKPAIVVCLATLKSQWEKEIHDCGDFTTHIVNSSDKTVPKKTVDFLILNYESLRKHANTIKNLEAYGILILDETHKKIKGYNTQSTKAVSAIRKPHNILLSGTPIINHPVEFFVPFHLMEPQRFKLDYIGWARFASRLCNGVQVSFGFGKQGWKFGQPTKEFADLVKKWVIRIRKEDVLTQLPPRVIDYLYVDLPDAKAKEYKAALDNYYKYLLGKYSGELEFGDIVRRARASRTQLIELKKVLAESKILNSAELADLAIDGGSKVLIFSQFRSICNDLKDLFGDKAVLYTGDQNEKAKAIAVDKFQNNSDVKVFVATTQSGGTGLNLTAADTVIFNDLGWTPTEHEQAMDRAHRIGSEIHQSINVYYLVARGTIDEVIQRVLFEKRDIVSKTLDGESVDTTNEESDIFNDLVERLAKHTTGPEPLLW